MPTTVDGVRVFLGLAAGRPDDALAAAVAGANGVVAAMRSDCAAVDDPENPPSWPAQVDYAATLYASRLYGRRSSVQGVAAFQDAGVQLLASDPDVAMLLELGRYQKSVTA